MLYFQKVLKFKPQAQPTPRDYLQTIEGLMFAVVNAAPIKTNRIVSWLRYIPTTDWFAQDINQRCECLFAN